MNSPTEDTEDTPVTISKKMMLVVTPRINDWLQRSTEFAYKLYLKTPKIDLPAMFSFLAKTWPRLLILYMIENNFDFCVTKENKPVVRADHTDFVNGKSKPDATASRNHEVKAKYATQLHHVILKGNEFGLTPAQYECLRELALFHEAGKENVMMNKMYQSTQKRLQSLLSETHSAHVFTRVLLYLPSIYNLKADIIESLFCSNLNCAASVQELFQKQLEKFSATKVTGEEAELELGEKRD